MAQTRGWFTTLIESDLLDGPVELRPLRIRDAGALRAARAANAPWLSPWDASTPAGPGQPSSVTRLASVLRRTKVGPYAEAVYTRLRALLGLEAYWVIWYKGQFAGQMTVFHMMWGPLRSAEVGYWVDKRFAGRGIAPATLAMAVDHCFQAMHLHRIEAYIQPENVASRRAVEKLGFRDEGLRERLVHVNGVWRDHMCYSLVADEVPDGLLNRWRLRSRGRGYSAPAEFLVPAEWKGLLRDSVPGQDAEGTGRRSSSSGSWPGLTSGARS
jgi:ribosomal-protein-alanine N-acetyltransferase